MSEIVEIESSPAFEQSELLTTLDERGIVARVVANRRESLEAMVGLRLFERLPELHLPVLLVGGDLDNIVPVATVLEAYGRIPHCGLQIYHRVGHMVQQEVPLEFAALVQDFVANRTRPAGASSGGAPPAA